MFIISEATVREIPIITDIAEQTWWPTYRHILTADQIRYMLDAIYGPKTLEAQIQHGLQTYLILRDHDGSQGFAAYGPHPDSPESYKLHKLYVLPHNHNKGYGRALIEEVKTRLTRHDIHRLHLNVNRHNPALRFYEKCGFKLIGEEDVPIGPYWMNDYVMRIDF
jgi:diamine N-acetyltransferase